MTISVSNVDGATFDENVAKQTSIAGQTQRELAQLCFSHAQLMIAMGLLQFTTIFTNIIVRAGDYLDDNNFQNVSQQVGIVQGICSTVQLAIFIIPIWLLFTSGIFQIQPLVKKHETALRPKSPAGSFIGFVGVAVVAALFVGAHGWLLWLKKTDLLPDGMIDQLRLVLSLAFSTLFFTYATLQIRRGMKYLMGRHS